MDDLNKQLLNMELAKKQKKLLEGLIMQLQKDFNEVGIQPDLSNLPPAIYDDLKSRLLPVIQELIEKHSDKFFILLYRIDIPEQAAKQVFAMDESIAKAERFTEMILERELKKVIIKYYFVNK
ncbi:hypothetical protein SAMN06265350_101128 [Solitalea koreensis]|uniref:Uncharacterized protein n=2 Tax=Solitalea koreensis TaxID=543615 RepID=A0A521AFV0_9SPHI|nr:hypothetical protein SAMN06265350_101128 [Solitalea koreensis]